MIRTSSKVSNHVTAKFEKTNQTASVCPIHNLAARMQKIDRDVQRSSKKQQSAYSRDEDLLLLFAQQLMYQFCHSSGSVRKKVSGYHGYKASAT